MNIKITFSPRFPDWSGLCEGKTGGGAKKSTMYKIRCTILALIFLNMLPPFIQGEVQAQAGQKWAVNGNSVLGGDFLGTTNNQPLIFKTSGIERGRFTNDGKFRVLNKAIFQNDVDVTFLLTAQRVKADTLVANNFARVKGILKVGVDGTALTFDGNTNIISSGMGSIQLGSLSGYTADFSSLYTSRSLVDKGWVESREYLTANQNILLSGDVTGSGTTAIAAAVNWGNGYPVYDSRYLTLSGGTLSGTLSLNADPTNPLEAATKQYVDGKTGYIPTLFEVLSSGSSMTGGDENLTIPITANDGNTIMAFGSTIPFSLRSFNTSDFDYNTSIYFNHTIPQSPNIELRVDYPSSKYTQMKIGDQNANDKCILVESNITNFRGIKYAADYSSAFVLRSLVDKQYVDNKVASSSLWTSFNNNISYNNGKVGIGTSTPSEQLEVFGTIYSTSGGFKFPDGSVQTTAFTENAVDALVWMINGNAGTTPGSDFIGTTDAQDLVLKTNNAERMRITSSGTHPGNVGIGTDDPEKKLHIVTKHTTCALCPPDSHEGIRLEEQTTYTDIPSPAPSIWDLQPFGSGFAIKRPNEEPKMVITAAGNVGIGTTNPSANKLEVAGTVNATSYLKGGQPFAAEWQTNNNDIYNGNSGNVGIGTTTPIQTLDVNGRINVANGVIQRGGPAITSTSDLGLYSLDDGLFMRFVTKNAPIRFYSDGDPLSNTALLSIESNGYVGIGTPNPQAQLDIFSPAASNLLRLGSANKYTTLSFDGGTTYLDTRGSIHNLVINGNSGNDVHFGHDIYVCGVVRTPKIRVQAQTCDFVFADNYKKMTWQEKEMFYKTKKHLPYIDEAAVMDKDGLDVGANFSGLLQNAEEDRLDITELFMRIEKVEKQNQMLEKQNEELKKQIAEIKK